MQKLLILVCCLFIVTASVFAQPAADSHIQQYTTENGLPSNGIKGLQWDEKTEFLWMATEAGIVRFNGVDFKSYTKENMPDIASERMLFIVRNNAGKMYLSDQPGNIFSIEKSKPVLWRRSDVSSSNNPYLSNYYLLGASDTIFRKMAGQARSVAFATSIDKIICLSDTSLFIQSHGTLYFQSINLQAPLEMPFEKENINATFKIGNNIFIRNTQQQFFLFDIKSLAFARVLAVERNGGLLKASGSNNLFYWQTGMDNPVFIDGENAWQLTYNGKTIIADLIFTGIPAGSYIKSVQYSEKNKLLFIGTESKGLIVINQNRVASKKRKDINSKNRNSYYSQVELADGNILTNESDIIGDNTIAKNTLPIQGKFSFNILHTNDSLLWYSQGNAKLGYNCLHKFNKITGETKVYGKIKKGDIVTASGGNIYLVNPEEIGILDGDSMKVLYKYPKELKGVVTFDFAEISPGILAVATCGGLLRFNIASNKFDTIFNKSNICVRSIWKYKDYVFFGTYGSGFYIYKNGQVKSMPLDKNKYLLYTHCFVPDDNGYCWISTNRGLFKANLDELVNVFEKNTSTAYYHYFGKKDGMEMTELNGGCTPCALKLRSNTISFPTMDGLLWVNPEKATPVLPSGDIYIDDIIIDNENKNPEYLAQHALPAGTGDIAIHLAFSAWCNKENIYIEYQLNDTLNWKPVNFESGAEIRFNNLPSGKYRLRIRKLNGFGFNNYTYKEISFSITTPWYKSWWFYLLVFLATLGMIWLYLHIRTNQYRVRQLKLENQVAEKTQELQQKNEVLEKNNTIKTRLISIISHDIVTPLKFVTVAGQNLMAKRNLMSEELQQETIQEMTNTSQELHLLSTNILNWIKYQNENRRMVKEQFNLFEMINQVMGVLKSLAKQKSLQLVNTADTELLVYQYFEPLKILIYNLLTNAINFSEKGKIIIAAIPAGDNLLISVKDEGVGMTANQIKNVMADEFIVSSANIDNRKGNGLGYLIIKDLVKMTGATLSMQSEKGNGTTVSVELPVNKNGRVE